MLPRCWSCHFERRKAARYCYGQRSRKEQDGVSSMDAVCRQEEMRCVRRRQCWLCSRVQFTALLQQVDNLQAPFVPCKANQQATRNSDDACDSAWS
jgi:hypothetical protein